MVEFFQIYLVVSAPDRTVPYGEGEVYISPKTGIEIGEEMEHTTYLTDGWAGLPDDMDKANITYRVSYIRFHDGTVVSE